MTVDTQEKLAGNDAAAKYGLEDSDFGPKEFLSLLLQNWPTILAFVFGGLFFSAVYLYLARPMYESEALALFETKSNELELAFGDAGGGYLNSNQTLAEVEVIRSQIVLGRVVKELALDVDAKPLYFPVIGEPLARRNSALGRVAATIPGLRRYVWSPTELELSNLEVPPGYEGVPFVLQVTEPGHYKLSLGDRILVLDAQVGQSVFASLAEDSSKSVRLFVAVLTAPVGAKFVVSRQKLTTAIRRVRSGLTVAEPVRGSGVIRIEATATSADGASKIANSVANAYLRQNVERRSAEAAQTLAFLKTQAPVVRAKVESAEGALNAYRLRNSSADLAKETELALTESADVERRRNEILQKRAELLISVTAEHPSIKALDIQSSRLSEQSGRVQKSIAKLPETQQELLRLRRDVEVNTGLYTTMLNNMQQLEVAEAGTLGNVRIIDEAATPSSPFSPKSPIVLLAGLVAGLAASLITLILRRLLDHAEHDPAVIERITGIPVYATVPFSQQQIKLSSTRKKAAESAQLLVTAEPHDPAIESMRSLRTTLHFSLFESKYKSILFTGPTPGIGKSFVTSNLSAVLAQTPLKVILIDADLRRGTVHEYFGLTRKKGLSDFVLGADIEDVLQNSSVDNLRIISTGAVPPNPSELLMSPRFSQLVAEAEALCDLVIIDTGPILAVADAAIIGRVAGATLLVMKAGQHTRREMLETIKRLLQVGVRVRGIVINQVGRGTGYYGYGKYGYYYSYGYGNKNH